MGFDKFLVQFDNSSAVYFPGQTVSGRVSVHCQTTETIRSIIAECSGKCEVTWSESETVGRRTETVHYNASEHYFYQRLTLFGTGESRELPPGQYEYPFSFTLPDQLPSSFEGAFGHVRYIVRAKADRPWKFDDEFKLGFTVNSIVDLNLIQEAKKAAINEDSKTVCCWCCQSGPISARAWIPQSGYVPGEVILFSGQVDNNSNKEIHSTKVRLVEKSLFRAQGKIKHCERVVGEVIRYPPDDVENWDKVPMIVPPVAPSGLPHCTIIKTIYILEFIVDPGTFSFNLTIPLEVTIGTIPYIENFGKFSPFPVLPSAPPIEPNGLEHYPSVTNTVGFIPPSHMDQYPNMPTPYYEESMFNGDLREGGDSDHLNIGFDTLFTPRYVTFPTGSIDQILDKK